MIVSFSHNTNKQKKVRFLRAVQGADLWFYAGIKHKTVKKENRMNCNAFIARRR